VLVLLVFNLHFVIFAVSMHYASEVSVVNKHSSNFKCLSISRENCIMSGRGVVRNCCVAGDKRFPTAAAAAAARRSQL